MASEREIPNCELCGMGIPHEASDCTISLREQVQRHACMGCGMTFLSGEMYLSLDCGRMIHTEQQCRAAASGVLVRDAARCLDAAHCAVMGEFNA